jgi:hypothetical protein
MMLHRCLAVSLFLTTFFLQISYLHSASHHLVHETDDHQRAQATLLSMIKNLLDAPSPTEQTILLNELREYLNRMCTAGYLGSSHAHACQHLLDIVQHYEETVTDESPDEHHGLQKRFFCNGFIGCKNAGRR